MTAVLLSACHSDSEGFFNETISVRGDGADFSVAFCTNTLLEGIALEIRPTPASPWTTVWEAHGGAIPLSVGDSIGAADLSMFQTSDSTSFEVDNGVELTVIAFTDQGTMTAGFLADSRYEPEKWLQTDGTLTESPCR